MRQTGSGEALCNLLQDDLLRHMLDSNIHCLAHMYDLPRRLMALYHTHLLSRLDFLPCLHPKLLSLRPKLGQRTRDVYLTKGTVT